jgi:hypothetical protein
LLSLGVFPEIHESIKTQKNNPSKILLVSNPKEIGWFLSRYEKEFDRVWKHPNTRIDLSQEKLKEETHWVKFWIDSLEELKAEITAFTNSGVDFETINHHVWVKVRKLVLKSAEDAFQLRLKRYINSVPLAPIQKILWKARSLLLEWRWGRNKVLYGSNEKFELSEDQDPAKSVRIFCGYCGSVVRDDNSRPMTFSKFDPIVFSVEKTTGKVVMRARSSVARYERPQTCFGCGSELQHAYVHKVGRAVMAVLL